MMRLEARNPNRQEPTLRPRVLYWSERINGWWPGVERHCGCGGWLDATPENTPTTGPGAISCLSCGREVADVLDRPALSSALTYVTCVCGQRHVADEPCRTCHKRRVLAKTQAAYRERQRTGVSS